MYDFDKTLSTKDKQEYRFIPELGISSENPELDETSVGFSDRSTGGRKPKP